MAEFNWQDLLKKNKWPFLVAFLGLFLLLISLFLLTRSSNSEVEIISMEEQEKKTIFVDLGGAVQRPGLYELPSGSRLNDLLSKAGGLTSEADSSWVEKNLNLAQELEDASKLYIPFKSESNILSESQDDSRININTASVSELDSLWGVGEKRASDIIDNRPYQSIDELIEEKIIPQDVYQRIKEEISVY